MRAGPVFLQFDWSRAGLSMDLPVLVYSHTKTSFKFLLRQGRYGAGGHFKPRRENLTGLLFCLDLSLPRSTDHRDRNLHSLSHRFQSSQARSVFQDLGLNILLYEKQTRLINSNYYTFDQYVLG